MSPVTASPDEEGRLTNQRRISVLDNCQIFVARRAPGAGVTTFGRRLIRPPDHSHRNL